MIMTRDIKYKFELFSPELFETFVYDTNTKIWLRTNGNTTVKLGTELPDVVSQPVTIILIYSKT
jgi:hypothetical protein